jgi:hypothetical protein
MVALEQAMYTKMPQAVHKYKFNKYPKSFKGSEVVQFLKDNSEYAKCDKTALKLGNFLIQRGTILHIERDYKELKNDKSTFYMFLKDKRDQGHVEQKPGAKENWADAFQGYENNILNSEFIKQSNLFS